MQRGADIHRDDPNRGHNARRIVAAKRFGASSNSGCSGIRSMLADSLARTILNRCIRTGPLVIGAICRSQFSNAMITLLALCAPENLVELTFAVRLQTTAGASSQGNSWPANRAVPRGESWPTAPNCRALLALAVRAFATGLCGPRTTPSLGIHLDSDRCPLSCRQLPADRLPCGRSTTPR